MANSYDQQPQRIMKYVDGQLREVAIYAPGPETRVDWSGVRDVSKQDLVSRTFENNLSEKRIDPVARKSMPLFSYMEDGIPKSEEDIDNGE